MKDLAARAAAWSDAVDLDAAVTDLVARDAVEIPPYPAVALRIDALVRAGDFGLVELARLVASDPTLAADVLRCANVAARSRGAPAASVAQAVGRIGAGELSRIALASALGAQALAPGPLAALRRAAWHEALASAVLCRALARPRGLATEEAFTCGLLHDFGKVLAIACLERITAGARHGPRMPAGWWEAIVERWHVPIGTVLARRWSLPEPVADAIALHHGDRFDGGTGPLVRLVADCDPVARALGARSHVGAGDAALAALGPEEAAAAARALETLPAFVASFERSGAPAATLVEAPPARSPARDAPAGLRVRIADQAFEVTGFHAHQLVVRGDLPLAEGLLLEAELLGAAPVTFHARVLACWSDPAVTSFTALLMPFALTGPALLRWEGLVAGRGRA